MLQSRTDGTKELFHVMIRKPDFQLAQSPASHRDSRGFVLASLAVQAQRTQMTWKRQDIRLQIE